jgi:methanethiol S-methyltransferase
MSHIILAIGWLAYGFVHSFTASPSVKNLVQNQFPRFAPYYRILYNTLATLTFILLLYYQYRIEKIRLWTPSLGTTVLGWSLAGIGLGVILMALRQYDLAEFAGTDALRSAPPRKNTLKTQGLLGLVRHPLYTGTLLLLWGLWVFDASLSSLIMAVCLSTYIRVGIYFEEKKLLRQFGRKYAWYRHRVPMLFPSLF